MGDTLDKLFVPLDALPALYNISHHCYEHAGLQVTFFGLVQLIFLGACYAYVLFTASKLISEGSELLLLTKYSKLVGPVVLPFLGAVPDGAIILFSGMAGTRKEAQKQLSIGVGALAGSSIMLLTVPWTISLVAGRVSIVGGKCQYKRPKGKKTKEWKKLNPNQKNIFTKTGVEPKRKIMNIGVVGMLVSLIPYVCIQISAFVYFGYTMDEIADGESSFALAGLILCAAFMVLYLGVQAKDSDEDEIIQTMTDEKRKQALLKGDISLKRAFDNYMYEARTFRIGGKSLFVKKMTNKRFEKLVRNFFKKYDLDGNGVIDRHELKFLLDDLHISSTPKSLDYFMSKMDKNGTGDIEFREFHISITEFFSGEDGKEPSYGTFVDSKHGRSINTTKKVSEQFVEKKSVYPKVEEEDEEEEEEEEEEVPDDLAHLSPEEQQKRIFLRSFWMMGLGTILVVLFSDPMVEVLTQVGHVTTIPPFFVAFLLAPVASNASEIIAAYNYASKKTSTTITVSLSALLGSAIMNNTFCLGIFMSLLYFRRLAWTFSAETIVILAIQITMAIISCQKTQTLMTSVVVASLFPFSILFVWILEYGIGLN